MKKFIWIGSLIIIFTLVWLVYQKYTFYGIYHHYGFTPKQVVLSKEFFPEGEIQGKRVIVSILSDGKEIEMVGIQSFGFFLWKEHHFQIKGLWNEGKLFDRRWFNQQKRGIIPKSSWIIAMDRERYFRDGQIYILDHLFLTKFIDQDKIPNLIGNSSFALDVELKKIGNQNLIFLHATQKGEKNLAMKEVVTYIENQFNEKR